MDCPALSSTAAPVSSLASLLLQSNTPFFALYSLKSYLPLLYRRFLLLQLLPLPCLVKDRYLVRFELYLLFYPH
jgi:hypothetical protein